MPLHILLPIVVLGIATIAMPVMKLTGSGEHGAHAGHDMPTN